MSTVTFEENQSFRQPWLWVLMLAVLAILVLASLQAPECSPWIGVGIVLAVALLLYSMKLTVQVDSETVRIRFFPFLNKNIALTDIVRWEARAYRPILEYGGWGIRSSFRKGWAYNVSGNQGVQLELANGKHILIGSASRGTGEGDWGGEGVDVKCI